MQVGSNPRTPCNARTRTKGPAVSRNVCKRPRTKIGNANPLNLQIENLKNKTRNIINRIMCNVSLKIDKNKSSCSGYIYRHRSFSHELFSNNNLEIATSAGEGKEMFFLFFSVLQVHFLGEWDRQSGFHTSKGLETGSEEADKHNNNGAANNLLKQGSNQMGNPPEARQWRRIHQGFTYI